MVTSRVREEVLVSAAPGAVWPLVTEGEHVKAWYAFGGADIELRPGGAMTLRWEEHGAFPAVVERVEPERLFAFRWLPAPGPLVEITLTAEGPGTRVRVVESGALDDAATSALAWSNGLSMLRALAEKDRRSA